MREDLRVDPNAELFTWGPVPVQLFYGDAPLSGCASDFKSYGIEYEWPKGLILFKEGRMIWIHEQRDIDTYGAALFRQHFLDIKMRETARARFDSAVEALSAVELKIDQTDLSSLSNTAFLSLWKEFLARLAAFWAHGFPPEMAGYGGLVVLRDQLSAVPLSARDEMLQILTAPEHMSFYQKEEIDLYSATDLAEHARTYAWLTNSYAHVTELTEEYFSERKRGLPANLIEASHERIEKVKAEKDTASRLYNLSTETLATAAALCDCITWQDDRKKRIWIYLQYVERILTELTRRFGLERQDCLQLRHQELIDHLEKGSELPNVNERYMAAGFQIGRGEVFEITTKEAQQLWHAYVPSLTAEVDQISGVVASKGAGLVKGKVCIVVDPLATPHFADGDILVTTMTTPDCVFLMKKAGAIITDTGGLTSHAAVVSRELHVACIVGTKVATHVLKDGDIVEVNTSTGTVHILK